MSRLRDKIKKIYKRIHDYFVRCEWDDIVFEVAKKHGLAIWDKVNLIKENNPSMSSGDKVKAYWDLMESLLKKDPRFEKYKRITDLVAIVYPYVLQRKRKND